MTELYIGGRLAVLPGDLSFTLAVENPYFTRSSSYTLDIELPMPVNHAIFGHINRLDVTKKKTILPATLIVDARCLLSGSAVLLSVEETLVKLQLVSGNAEFNLLTNDNIYIDDLDLGTAVLPEYDILIEWLHDIETKKKYYGSVDDCEVVWCPVLCQDKLYNNTVWGFSDEQFHPDPYGCILCAQPYLITVIKRICSYFGYTFDASFFDGNFLRNVYLPNAVQSLEIADALPHWTVSEFFNELEQFTSSITVVDERTKTVRLVSLNNYYTDSPVMYISQENVFQTFSVEIEEKLEEKDTTIGNVEYDLTSPAEDGFLKLDRYVFSAAEKIFGDTYEAVKAKWQSMQNSLAVKGTVFIAQNRYYINYVENNASTFREVNLYGDIVRDEDNKSSDATLRIVLTKIQAYNQGRYRVKVQYILGKEPDVDLWLNVPVVATSIDLSKSEHINIQDIIEGNAELREKRTRKSVMEVAFNIGLVPINIGVASGVIQNHFASPFTDYTQYLSEQEEAYPQYSLSLHDVCMHSIGHCIEVLQKVDTSIPYTIQFTADKLPNVNNPFLIGNKLYLCEKIEVEVGINGLSKVMEGTFYRID